MRWIALVGFLTTTLLAGCRGGGEPTEPTANQQAANGGQQAQAGDGSAWADPTEDPQADRPRTGTGSVEEQQEVQAELLDEDDEARTGQPAGTTGEQRAAAGDTGEGANGVYQYGQQIEAEEPEQLGIADGYLAAPVDDRLAVRRPDGQTVEMVVEEDALVVMDGAPVAPERLADLREGTPIRAEYSQENGRNVADRIEVPVRGGETEPGQQYAPQQQQQQAPSGSEAGAEPTR